MNDGKTILGGEVDVLLAEEGSVPQEIFLDGSRMVNVWKPTIAYNFAPNWVFSLSILYSARKP